MKIRSTLQVVLGISFSLALLLGCTTSSAPSNPHQPFDGTTINLVEDTAPIFRNPGKGWVFYTTWFGGWTEKQISRGSVAYSRYSWADLEPTEGVYNWKKIDDEIARCKSVGLKYAFGVMNVSMDWGPDDGFAVPQWVFKAGATSYRVKDTRRPSLFNVIPHWTNNPVFFSKMNHFIDALGTRYNGHPTLAWVDIRNFGNWGEGHLGNIDRDESGRNVATPDIATMRKDYYRPYLSAFPDTQLILPWGFSGHDPAYAWAVDNGIGMRRDGLPDWSDGRDIAFADGKEPAIVEYTANYRDLVSQKKWTDASVTKAVLNAHASFAEISRGDPLQFMSAANTFMENLANRIGYHFVLASVSAKWDALEANTEFPLRMQWLNRGITRLYEKCHVKLALLDEVGSVVESVWLEGVDPRTWKPGKITETINVQFQKAGEGTYTLAVGLFTSKSFENPDFRIGNTERDVNGWYHLVNDLTLGD